MVENEYFNNLEICLPTKNDLNSLIELFSSYPHKKFQQKFQNIDKKILTGFFAEGFIKSAKQKDTISLIIKRNNSVIAAGGVSYNDWHTQNFGIRMGRISNFVINPESMFPPKILLDILLHNASELNLRHLSCRFDADEWENIHLCESEGFYLVDCSVKFGLGLPSKIRPDEKFNIEIVPCSDKYLDAIMTIAATSHQTNHFYADKNLPKEKTQQLFANWVKRLAYGNAKSIYVALKDNNPIAFIIFLENRTFNQKLAVKIAILDYVVLDKKLQGQGLGSELLAKTLSMLENDFEHVELRTSHNNYAAVNTYQKFGFKLISTDIVMHKILD